MIDRWYYAHAGQMLGPVTAAQLRQLASAGQLAATDAIWPEGKDRTQAIDAAAAVDFSTLATPPPTAPDWLDDVRAAAKENAAATQAGSEKKRPAATTPADWLDDVRAAEEAEQASLTTFEWDGDTADAEEEMAKQILDELEEVPDEEQLTEFIPEPPQPAASAGPGKRFLLGSATTRGRVRDRNEDSLLVQQCTWSNLDRRHDVALIVVADGMGGHQAGDRASGLVIRAMGGVLAPLLSAALGGEAPPTRAVLAETLDRGLLEAHRLVLQTAKDNNAYKGMGSTAAALLIWEGHAFISLVGDCRVYHQRGGQLTQVTRDQTLVARMVELGQLTAVEAAKHPRRNEVTQALGTHSRIQPARYEVALQRGDWLIASCDGLYAHVEDRMLAEAIGKADSGAAELANRLIELANQGGGSDNCTVVAVQCV